MIRLENVRSIGESRGLCPGLWIEMEYLPTLSVNRYKTARGITRREVQKWMADLAFVMQTSEAVRDIIKAPIKLRLEGVFKDKRHPDMDNLLKVTCDAVKQGLGIDDKDYIHETKHSLGVEPKLIITISNYKETKEDLWG